MKRKLSAPFKRLAPGSMRSSSMRRRLSWSTRKKCPCRPGHVDEEHLARLEKDWTVHKIQWERLLKKIDFFNAPSQGQAKRLVAAVQKVFEQASAPFQTREDRLRCLSFLRKTLKGRLWITRLSPYIDRLACAWLIRRFIDSKRRASNSLRNPTAVKGMKFCFDMAEGEFTHFRRTGAAFENISASPESIRSGAQGNGRDHP